MKAQFTHRPIPLASHPLARKLAIVTALKLLVLMALWWAFFSGHAQRGAELTPDQAADAILHPKITETPKIPATNGDHQHNAVIWRMHD